VLAGAGAAAAAKDAAGYFKFELLRRVALEFVLPWVSLLLAERRKKAGKLSNRQPDQRTGQAVTPAAPAQPAGATTTSAGTVGSAMRAAFGSADNTQQQQTDRAAAANSDVLRPAFDPFTGIRDVTRDMG
jgi:hypothetical protein